MITVDDLKRLFIEMSQGIQEHYSGPEATEKWLNVHGLDEQIAVFLKEQAEMFFMSQVVELDANGMGVALLTEQTLGAIMGALLIGGMTLGWEMHAQFGPEKTDLSGFGDNESGFVKEEDALDT